MSSGLVVPHLVRFKRRHPRANLWLVAVTILAMIFVALPAQADNLTPANCRKFVRSYTSTYRWEHTCNVGQNGTYYERNGMLTMGVQRWIYGINGGPNFDFSGCFPHDGYFGSSTEDCVYEWQDLAPDTPSDGIIHGQDWKVLESYRQLVSCDASGYYCYYKTALHANPTARRWQSNGYWYVLDGDESQYRSWDRNGPYT